MSVGHGSREGRRDEQCVVDLGTRDLALGDLGRGALGLGVQYKAELDGSNAAAVGYWVGVDEIMNES